MNFEQVRTAKGWLLQSFKILYAPQVTKELALDAGHIEDGQQWVRCEAGCTINPQVPIFALRVDGLITIREDQA